MSKIFYTGIIVLLLTFFCCEDRSNADSSETGTRPEGRCIEGDCENGIGTFAYKDSTQKYTGRFVNGIENGNGKYFENGKLLFEGEVKNGKVNGKGILYYDNGSRYYEGEWKNSKFEGKGILYFQDGKVLYKGDFKNGEYHGTGELYYKDDKKYYLEYKGPFAYGVRHGKVSRFNSDGKLWYTTEYKMGWEKNKYNKATQYTIDQMDVISFWGMNEGHNNNYYEKVKRSYFDDNSVLTLFGKIGDDNYTVEVNGKKRQLVGSPIEFYYTDLVFLRNDYETALVGLYRNLAEMPNKRGEINEAIGLVKEVAKRRGVNVSENNAKARYRREITDEILTAGSAYSSDGKYREYCNVLIDYYLNPTNSNFNKVMSKYTERSTNITNFGHIVNALSPELYQDIARQSRF